MFIDIYFGINSTGSYFDNRKQLQIGILPQICLKRNARISVLVSSNYYCGVEVHAFAYFDIKTFKNK